MPSTSRPCTDLAAYLTAVNGGLRTLLDESPLLPDQVRMLRAATRIDEEPANPLRHVVTPLYLLIRAVGGQPDEAAVRLGIALVLMQRGMHLIDDVQDDEVPESFAGANGMLAMNAGLSLFFLAFDQMRRAEALLPTDRTRPSPWDSLFHHAVRSCRAQHLDICGRGQPRSSADAVALATERYALACVLTETAGMCVASREEDRQALTRLGDALACIHQMIDDVSDLFGSTPSSDLRTGTWTAPIAFLYESLPDNERAGWVARLDNPSEASQAALCGRVYESGAMHRVAELLANERKAFLTALATVAADPSYAAMLMAWLDDLVGVVHRPSRAPKGLDILAIDARHMAPTDRALYRRLRDARALTVARTLEAVQP